MTNKELFIQQVDKHWEKVKNNEDTIFENVEMQIDASQRFEELKEKDHDFYIELLHESSLYNKKRMIESYFWDRIVGEMYEDTLIVMKDAGLLEEATQSFEKSYKIEQTARLILEKGVFANYDKDKKKDSIDYIIEAAFYPEIFAEKHQYEIISYDPTLPIEELMEASLSGALSSIGNSITPVIRGAARWAESLKLLAIYFLVSPATFLGSTVAGQGVQSVDPGLPGSIGTSSKNRKFLEFLDQLSPVNWIFSFMTKDQKKVFEYIRRANNLDDEFVKETLDEVGAKPEEIVAKCWQRNKLQPSGMNREDATVWEKVRNILSGKGIANVLRNPRYLNTNELIVALNNDAGNPTWQKHFYDFRVCVYDKLFEIILGYAKAIYSMDNESYEVIKAANDAHKTKNYKKFFDLRPKDDSDKAMFMIMRTLVSIDNIARVLKDKKGTVTADKYIDQFINYLEQNIKSTYKELDELANLRKYNQDRYDEEDPDEDEKIKKIREGRFNEKKSIFED